MSTLDPPPPASAPASPADGGPPPEPAEGHNRWKWISVALGVIAVGLLIWALATRSDLNDSQDQLDQNKQAQSEAGSAAKGAYDDVTDQLGLTSAQLDESEQQVKDAEASANKAQEDAAAAQKDAASAKNATDKAQAEADQAKAESEEATSKLAIATDCAKAYASALGDVFKGDDLQAQAAAVKQKLEGVTAECKAAFGS